MNKTIAVFLPIALLLTGVVLYNQMQGVLGGVLVSSRTDFVPKTTSPELAIANLRTQIREARRILKKYPDRGYFRKKLYDLLSTEVQFVGNFSAWKELERLAEEAPSSHEGDFMRARFAFSRHDFSLVESILDTIGSSDSYQVSHLRRLVHIAKGVNLVEMKSSIEDSTIRLGYSSDLLRAELYSSLGEYSSADKIYELAVKSYGDSSPFPLAYLYFRRGVMWGERIGDLERAYNYYTIANNLMPKYATAAVHLSEILVERGELERALEILNALERTEDPEVFATRAEILKKLGRPFEKDLLKAKSGYNNLLEKYPLAFSDHGSEFYGGIGSNAKKSLDLALFNFKNRDTERSQMLVLEAAKNAQDLETMCKFIGLRDSPKSRPLKAFVSENMSDCLFEKSGLNNKSL